MIYKTYQTNSELNPFIKCIWTLEGASQKASSKQRIIPDGCLEMIFHLGDLYKQYLIDGSTIIQPRSFVFGQITHPLDIEPTGETKIFAFRFFPGGFLPFTTLPPAVMQNRAVPLQELYGESGADLEKRILQVETVSERIAICEIFLQNRLSHQNIDQIIKDNVSLILGHKGNISVSELSRETNIHRKQLERKFSSVVGISPKQLAKIIRIQAILKMLTNKQFTSLTALAYEGEYYDQSHFIKDFKEFTGQSPGKFYADNLQMSTLFHEDD